MASTWFNDSGVTVYAVTRNASFTVVYEAEIAAGASWSDGTATNSGANAVAFLTSASTNANGNGTDVEAYLGGSPPRTKSGFSGGTIAYPGSGQYYTIASQSGERNLTDNSARSSTVARTKIGHKLLARYGVRRDAIQSGSIEVGHMNFVASEGDASWGGALADTDLFAIHDTSADVVRGIELIDLKSYLSQSVLDATVFNGSIGVTGSISLTSHLRVKDDKKLYFGDGDDSSIEYDEDGADVLQIAGANVRIGHGAATQLQFRDDAVYINSDADGSMNVRADSSIDLNINGTDVANVTSAGLNVDGTLTGNTSLTLDSTTISTAEIGVLDTAAANEVVFSKAVIYGTAGQITGSSLNVGGTITGDTSLTLDSTTISTAELGVLDTAAANEVVFSKAVIYGTAGQITGSSLNVGGTITGDTSLTLDSTTITTAEIGVLDSVTAGTAAASKAVVLDGSKNIATIGTVGCGAITSTGASSFGSISGVGNVTSTGTVSGSAATFHTIEADKLDVRVINTSNRTEDYLHVQDKGIVVAVSASKANTDGAGFHFGGRLNGDDESDGPAWAAILYDNSNSAIDFNISGTTEIRLQDGVLRPESDNDVDLGASGAEFKDLYLDGTANVDLLKLPDVTSGKILVADGTSYEEVAISGDVTISSAGAVTIANDAVESGMLNDNVISGQSALGSAGVAQADELLFSDAGTLKKVTFSNFEDSIFGNVSGDATVAAGGALTIANDAVENSMLHKSVVLDSTGSHGGLNFRNGVLSVGSHVYHFMSSSSPTIISSSANTQLVASTIGSGGDGDYNIYVMSGSKGALTASLGFTTASHGGGMPASGSLKVYLNGILLFGALDRGGATRTTAANPIPHTSVDYRWDDKKNIQSVVSGSRILLNPNLALDSDDILTVEYLSGTIQGHHSY